jgi:integrase/recombinase XerD
MAMNMHQQAISSYLQGDRLQEWTEAFIMDRKARNLSRRTVEFYTYKLKYFTDFCFSKGVMNVLKISPSLLRDYLLDLETKGHNPGGCHAAYRTVKSFLLWWENEVEPDDWSNPIRKVKAPKVAVEPLDPVNIVDVRAMIEVCPDTLTGHRDRAMMLFLLDTGVRASELVSLDLEDVNLITGDIMVRKGKGRKPRFVYLGSKSRKTLRAYLKLRKDACDALWITDDEERITYWGVKSLMVRRAGQAGVNIPQLHAFRRWFALSCLRTGMNIYSLQELMGHSDLQLLKRYLKLTNQDTREAHRRAGPVDNLYSGCG